MLIINICNPRTTPTPNPVFSGNWKFSFVGTSGFVVQPVPWKMRLGMIIEMQIEILNGGEILVHCKTKITI